MNSDEQQTTPAYAPPVQTAGSLPSSAKDEDPGLALGVAAMAFIFSGLQIVGVVLAIIGMKKSKGEGYTGTVSRLALILNIIMLVLIVVAFGLYIILLAAFSSMGGQSY